MKHVVHVKRVYDPPEASDGARVLVDRLWPRGLSKAKARITLWAKDVAPTNELREWFHHDPERWPEFQKRYNAELAHNEALAELTPYLREGKVTLLYGARDAEHNNAIVLADFLRRR